MALKTTIKELRADISGLEREIKYKYEHPEDKLREAQEEYRDCLIRQADHIIESEMRILELMPELTKPLVEVRNEYRINRK